MEEAEARAVWAKEYETERQIRRMREERRFSAIMWTIVLLPFAAAFLLLIYLWTAEEFGWPIPRGGIWGGDKTFPYRATQKLIGIYLCTDDNYNPDEWRVTPKTVSRTFDGGKTWQTVWSLKNTSRYIIRKMEDRNKRGGESLPPGKRDIILIIEGP